jgi:hypothetical protein
MRPLITISLIFLALTQSLGALGQSLADAGYKHPFIPRELILFADDFSHSASDTFPSGWFIKPCDGMDYTTGKYCHISRDSDRHFMVIKAFGDPHASTLDNLAEPRKKSTDYLPDSFTIEYDFRLGSAAAEEVLYIHYEQRCYLISCAILHTDDKGWIMEISKLNNTYSINIPGTFNYRLWHHFALSFYRGSIQYYLDSTRLLSIPNCNYDPYGFMLSADGRDSISYTNVRLATGDYADNAENRKMKIIRR